jgi:hypothetical protein
MVKMLTRETFSLDSTQSSMYVVRPANDADVDAWTMHAYIMLSKWGDRRQEIKDTPYGHDYNRATNFRNST